MDCTDGDVLGKYQQGLTTNLGAYGYYNNLGVGATTDLRGNSGWSKTNENFGRALGALRRDNCGGGCTMTTGETTTRTNASATAVTASSSDARSNPDLGGREDMKHEKKERRRKKRREKRTEEKSDKRNNGFGGGGAGLTLAKNKVLAGHSHKIRDAKDLTTKSAADMAAIFGVRADVYSPSDVVDPNSKPSTPSGGGVGGGSR